MFRMATTYRALLLLLFSIVAAGSLLSGEAWAGAVDRELQKSIRGHSPSEPVPVIIYLAEKTELRGYRDLAKRDRRTAVAKALRRNAEPARERLRAHLRQRNALHIRSLWIANAVAATVPAGDIEQLASLPGVERVVLDAIVHAPVTTHGTSTVPGWNLSAVHAPDLWALGYQGQGVVVANMDSGVDLDHPDLQPRWRGGLNSWYDPHNEHPLTPYDATGHGTQTMGLMIGGDAGGTAIGVAPGARWIAVKIFNDADSTTYSAIHQGFQWLLDPDGDPDSDDAPDVVNHSWGLIDPAHGCISEFRSDVEALESAGIAQAFSAGNDGPVAATSVSPANYAGGFSVGSVDSTNTVASASSRGPSACTGGIFPTVVAPGANVLTADLFLGIPNAYVSVSGTSFAAPHAAGAMALLLDVFPAASPSELNHFLRSTALDIGPAGEDNETGAGLVDVLAAYSALMTSPTGSVTINGDGGATNTRWVTLSLNAADPDGTVTGMRFSWDNAIWYAWEPFAASRSATLPAGADGPRTIHVRFRDNAGNLSALYKDSILLDQTAPLGSIAINGDAAATGSRYVVLTLNAVDASSAVTNMRFSWDGVNYFGWEPYAASRQATLPPGPDGSRTIQVQFRDSAGNVSTAYTDAILLDQTPPTGSVLINGGAATTGSRYVTLTLNATDASSAVTSMRFSWDGVNYFAWEPFATTRNATIPGGPGIKTLRIQFRDSAGNASGAFSDGIELL